MRAENEEDKKDLNRPILQNFNLTDNNKSADFQMQEMPTFVEPVVSNSQFFSAEAKDMNEINDL